MGRQEGWLLLNIDRREDSGGFDSLKHAFLEHRCSLGAKKWLTLPSMTKKIDHWLATRRSVVQTGSFSKVSVELLDLIFEFLAASTSHYKFTDMIMFAITCTNILVVGERHLLRALRAHHAYWAHGRLIMVNDLTNWDDLPPGLLTEVESRELETRTPEYHHSGGDHGTLYEFALQLYTHGIYPDDRAGERAVANELAMELYMAEYPGFGHVRRRDIVRVPVSGQPWDDMKRFLSIYNGRRPTTEKDAISVLCNLSKTEYVRSDMLSKEDPSDGWFELDSALLSRVCWCTEPEDFDLRCEGEYRMRLMRGPWAGDRFCIVTLDMLEEVFDGKEGKDVSEETRALLQHIWTFRTRAEEEVEESESMQHLAWGSAKSHIIEDSESEREHVPLTAVPER
ncbi:hypothetical protein K466DRAFT_657400 [Polyporus arcularius HHB13444]|uniref:Uncharacterized protein n=1 Tax=Polyporus arcularius HHB13444 TaxID=1314778 RepID=A0A5C3PZ44_9APHY|nr:hypothetical protein K466DRAFT_657400 [Polyporus arcularius HHB13444]